MKVLTVEQFLAVAGVRKATYAGFVNRGESVLAFGTQQKLAGGNFLDLDAVAWLILDELTPALSRRHAAVFMRAFSDVWMGAVGRAERTPEPVFLVVGESGEKNHGHQRNTYEKISADFGTMPEWGEWDYRRVKVVPARITMVNISSVLAVVRWRASAIGLKLASPMVPEHDEPAFAQACADLKEARRAMAPEPRKGAQ